MNDFSNIQLPELKIGMENGTIIKLSAVIVLVVVFCILINIYLKKAIA